LISNDFKEEDWAYKDNFVPKTFYELAEINKQIFDKNQKNLKYEWQREKTRMIEKIQDFFHSQNFEIITAENFCSSFIFQALS